MAEVLNFEAREALARLSPVSPFLAVEPHFGMLLGVEDLKLLLAYPRGKQRLHNAWLHGEGVVWGFRVVFNTQGELEVTPGLALDRAGHELYLDRSACVDLAKWFAAHRTDSEFDFVADGQDFLVTLAVVARFKPCLSRPVPAIADDCGADGTATRFSRVNEGVELLLRPVPADRALAYRRLRVLFGHTTPVPGEEPELDQIAAQRAAILASSIPDQLAEFRRLAALDVTDLAPQIDTDQRSLFPEDPTEVLLAVVNELRLVPDGDGWAIDAPTRPEPDVTVRPAHLATRAIQELLVPPCCTGAAPAPGAQQGPTVTEVELSSSSVFLTLSAPVSPASVTPDAFTVSRFTSTDGWAEVEIGSAVVDDTAASFRVELRLAEDLVPSSVRVIARGTGPRPLLGETLLPLGYDGDGASLGLDGRDFVFMQTFTARPTRR